MKRLAWFALVLVGCGEEAGEDFPIYPGGGGGAGGSSRRDAAVDLDAEATITGRVCVLTVNLRTLSPAGCATSGADNLTVTLGTASAMTSADGSFTLMRPAVTTGLYWAVSDGVTDPAIVPSRVKYGTTFGTTTTTLLPAFDSAVYAQMVADNQAPLDGGAIVVRVAKTGAPVVGATIATQPDSQVLYDSDSDAAWNTDVTGTGANGVAWVPSIAGSSAQLTVSSGTLQPLVLDAQVAQGAITFVLAEFP